MKGIRKKGKKRGQGGEELSPDLARGRSCPLSAGKKKRIRGEQIGGRRGPPQREGRISGKAKPIFQGFWKRIPGSKKAKKNDRERGSYWYDFAQGERGGTGPFPKK